MDRQSGFNSENDCNLFHAEQKDVSRRAGTLAKRSNQTRRKKLIGPSAN